VISVCLAARDGARHIRAQVESILASPRVNELLISDDGSTDGTQEVLQAMRDPRLRLLSGPRRGVIRNFEFLLGQAAGEYIFLSDQDDVWDGRKVETMVAALRDADLAVSDCAVVDEKLRVVVPSFFAARHSGPGVLKNLWRNTYLGCCMAFRRRVLEYVLPIPPSVPMHDWWIGLMADLKGRVCFVEEVLVMYRRHGANATYAVVSEASFAQQLRWRLGMARALLARA
jgi:glycosyltransferase involved in cell wall biosynthesis